MLDLKSKFSDMFHNIHNIRIMRNPVLFAALALLCATQAHAAEKLDPTKVPPSNVTTTVPTPFLVPGTGLNYYACATDTETIRTFQECAINKLPGSISGGRRFYCGKNMVLPLDKKNFTKNTTVHAEGICFCYGVRDIIPAHPFQYPCASRGHGALRPRREALAPPASREIERWCR